jgi:hypothetical protein
MISGFGLSICTAAASSHPTDHNQALLTAVDPLVLQCIHIPPFPEIEPPAIESPTISPAIEPLPPADLDISPATIPVVCKIYSHATPAQADSGANCAITDNISLLHNMRQLDKPFPVGSINADNKIYCTAIGKLRLLTEEGGIEPFPCFYCARSAGTVILPDHKCTTSSHITRWEQAGDTRTGKGAICFRNPQHEVIATLPTFRHNGLWYTEIAAVPATAPATVCSLEAPASADTPEYHSAITDSDRHYPPLPQLDIDTDNDTDALVTKTDTSAADALDAHVAIKLKQTTTMQGMIWLKDKIWPTYQTPTWHQLYRQSHHTMTRTLHLQPSLPDKRRSLSPHPYCDPRILPLLTLRKSIR